MIVVSLGENMLGQLPEIFLPILSLLLTGSFLILSVIALPFKVYQFQQVL
jgi:hypothetical protein